MQQSDSTTVKVVVPTNLGPDRRILVELPDGRKISAVVPKGRPAGSEILLQIPSQPIKGEDLRRSPQQPPSPPSSVPDARRKSSTPPIHNRVQIIKVPKSKQKKGEKFQVRLPDGRTITATVPYNGCQEFSLDTSTQSKQERQQNWHDNPLAIAPVVLGPLLM